MKKKNEKGGKINFPLFFLLPLSLSLSSSPFFSPHKHLLNITATYLPIHKRNEFSMHQQRFSAGTFSSRPIFLTTTPKWEGRGKKRQRLAL
eukprot:m.66979 g.66979  ORF g.66979 m.66979 type:complete len:91 (+) comp8200_c1_seq1:340-612(+)